MLEKSYARYEAALHGLTRYGMKLRTEGHKFYEYGRVLDLAERLKAHYTIYRRTNNITKLQAEIDRFLADPWQLNVTEDGLIPARLGELLHDLRQGVQGLTLTVSASAPSQAPAVPAGEFLTMDARYTREKVTT